MDLGLYGVTVPSSYAAMQRDGLLRYGASRDDWKQNWHTLLLTAPPALAATDFEWMPPEEILETATANGGRSPLRPAWPDTFRFVQFAHNGAGDGWGWAPTLADDGAHEAPIVFIEHDSDEAFIVAPTFHGFVFRMTLESLAEIHHDPKQQKLAETVAIARGRTRRVLPYLPPELAWTLERVLGFPLRKVVTRRLREDNGTFYGKAEGTFYHLVFESTARAMIRRALAYPRLDELVPA